MINATVASRMHIFKLDHLQYRLVSGRNLDTTLVRAWEEIRLANPELASPYFSPEFTKIVAAVRKDVEVAVISQEGQPVAFFPFQRKESDRSVGIQVADFISDFGALICKQGFTCDPLELIRECGLVTYNFHNFLASQESFTPFQQYRDPSPQIDLSRGYDAYTQTKHAEGSDLLKSCANLARRMEREIGPLRFVAHSADPALLRQALALKSEQYLRTGGRDIFEIDWVRAVIERIHATQTDSFAGMLSLLYAGDQLVATHFGMRSQTVWHYWFPAYDKEMAKYSPGLQLILKMAEHAPSMGLHTIDLDRGNSLYKKRLMNEGGVVVAMGSVDSRYSRRIAQRAWRLRMAAAKSPLAAPVRRLVRWARR